MWPVFWLPSSFVFWWFSAIQMSLNLNMMLRGRGHVTVVTSFAFGCSGCLRDLPEAIYLDVLMIFVVHCQVLLMPPKYEDVLTMPVPSASAVETAQSAQPPPAYNEVVHLEPNTRSSWAIAVFKWHWVLNLNLMLWKLMSNISLISYIDKFLPYNDKLYCSHRCLGWNSSLVA